MAPVMPLLLLAAMASALASPIAASAMDVSDDGGNGDGFGYVDWSTWGLAVPDLHGADNRGASRPKPADN
jgi:hypothetical protein